MSSKTNAPVWDSAAGVASALARMYGGDFAEQAAQAAGVVHVTAVWREPVTPQRDNRYITLRINQDTPKSDYDFFVLNAARARADAIVTSGKILRDEPEVVHDLQGPRGAAEGLAGWRRDMLGKSSPPYVLILTSGRGLPADRTLADWHPALRSWARPIVYTGEAAASSLMNRTAGRTGDDRIRVIGSGKPSLRSAIAYLRNELGCQTIAIETGPSTSTDLYTDPIAVDELMLTVFCGDGIPDTVRGLPFITGERIETVFSSGASNPQGYQVTEPSGEWRFYRYWRGS